MTDTTPKAGLTYEQERARLGEAMGNVKASIKAELQVGREKIAVGTLTVLLTFAVLALGLFAWVKFIAICVQFATHLGWLP